MPSTKWHTSSFERCSFLFGADLLPAVYTPGTIERASLLDTRQCDMPRFIGADGKAHHLRGWTAYRSTPDDHQRWLAEGHNAVLHHRAIYGLRMPDYCEDEFIELTGIKTPLLVREGQRWSILALFKVSPDGNPAHALTGLKSRLMAEPEGRSNKTIQGSGDLIEFLGEGSTSLVYGRATNGSSVAIAGSKQLVVPTVAIDRLERFWRGLAETYYPRGDGHSGPPMIIDPRERLGQSLYATCMRELPPDAAMFLGWMAQHGKLVGFDGTTASVVCPFHPHIRTKPSHRPAKFDMLTGEMSCPHPTCQRLGRTRTDFEGYYRHRFGMATL
jgi:hypothetical protein